MDLTMYNGLKFYIQRGKLPSNINEKLRKEITSRANNFKVKSGQLFFQEKNKEERLVVTLNNVEKCIKEAHSGAYGGHNNAETTYQRLKPNFYWPNMFKIIEGEVKSCAICQRRGTPKKNNLLKPITVKEPFELIGIDLIGPLRITSSGNKYIIVMTEYLTKWVEAKAIPDKKASTVAEFVYNEVITRFGAPKRMLSDQGTEFLNETIAALQSVMKIKGIHSSPYHPQANGHTERMNKTLCDMLAKYTLDHGEEWDKWISAALYAYRTKKHTSTGFTPSFLLYGFQMNTPLVLDMYKDISDDENELELTAQDHANLIGERLKTVRNEAQKNVAKAQERQKSYHDKKIKETKFKIGQQVLLYDSATQHTHGDKFRDIYKGPYYIHEVYDNGTYKLRENDGRVTKKVINGNRLKAYEAKPAWGLIVEVPQVENAEASTSSAPIRKKGIKKTEVNNKQSESVKKSETRGTSKIPIRETGTKKAGENVTQTKTVRKRKSEENIIGETPTEIAERIGGSDDLYKQRLRRGKLLQRQFDSGLRGGVRNDDYEIPER